MCANLKEGCECTLHGVAAGRSRAACRQTHEESARASTVPVKGVLQRGVYACTRLAPIVISLILPYCALY